MRDFTGQTIVITGAGSGIGRATAVLLATEGTQLTLVDLDEQGLTDTHDEIQKAAPGTSALLVTADVSRGGSRRRCPDDDGDVRAHRRGRQQRRHRGQAQPHRGLRPRPS
ncbi:SDR family NAD(P)-dependent oxidoreductase [Micromonospora profundi]|uniref:SDR family NAD(P)-dependent oxidoreductase n=1 Tax=Micromonospora profundi TaxID=1420889 RepID=UPI00367793E5